MKDFSVPQNVNLIELARDFLFFLEQLQFNVAVYNEDDGSFTGVVKELDLVENAVTVKDCVIKLCNAMKDYAGDFCSDFKQWSSAPNRKSHVPYILKIVMSSEQQLMESMICRDGKN